MTDPATRAESVKKKKMHNWFKSYGMEVVAQMDGFCLEVEVAQVGSATNWATPSSLVYHCQQFTVPHSCPLVGVARRPRVCLVSNNRLRGNNKSADTNKTEVLGLTDINHCLRMLPSSLYRRLLRSSNDVFSPQGHAKRNFFTCPQLTKKPKIYQKTILTCYRNLVHLKKTQHKCYLKVQ